MTNPCPPLPKRLMRACWRVLPRSKLSFNLGKLLTRSVLRPAPHTCPVPVRFGGQIPMTLDLGAFVANDLYCLDDHYESTTLRLWRQLAGNAETVLDVGSHIGTFALIAAAANPRARVVAVEADEHNFQLLQNHCAGFANLQPVRAAIADRGAEMWFCPDGSNDGGGYLSSQRTSDPRCYRLHTCSLTELCVSQNLTKIDLMKMDVEGFERTIIVGDEDFWRRFAPQHLVIELTLAKAVPAASSEIFAAMAQKGYTARRLQGLYALPWGKPDDLANWLFTRG